jgi:hypothetical protein
MWEHLKEHVYAVSHETVDDLVKGLIAAVTTLIANMFKAC